MISSSTHYAIRTPYEATDHALHLEATREVLPYYQILRADAERCHMSAEGLALTITELIAEELSGHLDAEDAPTVSDSLVSHWKTGRRDLPLRRAHLWCRATESLAILEELAWRLGCVAVRLPDGSRNAREMQLEVMRAAMDVLDAVAKAEREDSPGGTERTPEEQAEIDQAARVAHQWIETVRMGSEDQSR